MGLAHANKSNGHYPQLIKHFSAQVSDPQLEHPELFLSFKICLHSLDT